MSQAEQKQGIFLGNRGDKFKEFIKKLVSLGGVNKKYVELLTNDESMKIYSSVFTSELVDSLNNYQVFEQLGDVSANQIIVKYMYTRFPQLMCTEGVKIVARLRIIYGAKQTFSEFARGLGFWEFISAPNEQRQRMMKPLLEDTFEAFLGATEHIIEINMRVGVGYAIIYDILASILDGIDISLEYQDLYDSKTRLKELFDSDRSLGSLVYEEEKKEKITVSKVYKVVSSTQRVKIGEGSASLKSDAQQNASTNALITLASKGISKPIPTIYKQLSTNSSPDLSEELIDSKKIKSLWGDTINILQDTKEKSKYQNKYQSTPLSLYCRHRNISGIKECLLMGADTNITDTDGMYPVDLLFIGKTNINIMKNILSVLLESKQKLKIHNQVFNMYFNIYTVEDDYFNSITDKFEIIKEYQ